MVLLLETCTGISQSNHSRVDVVLFGGGSSFFLYLFPVVEKRVMFFSCQE